MLKIRFLAISSLCVATAAPAQSIATLTPQVRNFVSVGDSVVALTNVTLIDGTGSAPKPAQTIIIRGNRIADVGATSSVHVPAGARVMQLGGSTVIPGIVGMHDHLFYIAAGGRSAQMSFTGPRLYLASGVTTIRTTGGRAPYAEINTKEAIDLGRVPGPRIHLTAPYITGGTGSGSMAEITSPDAARRFVAYWAQEGMEWIKSSRPLSTKLTSAGSKSPDIFARSVFARQWHSASTTWSTVFLRLPTSTRSISLTCVRQTAL